MTKKLVPVAILALAACAVALLAADPAREKKLQQGIDLMESKGDIAKAIPMFEDVARSSDPALAARALLLLGQAQERQGEGKARATYQRILSEYPNQADAVAEARKRLAGLSGPTLAAGFSQRQVCEECGDWNDISFDGRWAVGTNWNTGDLEIRDVSTGGVVRKLMVKTGDYNTSKDEADTAVFSKDGREIAYQWWHYPNGTMAQGQLRVIANEPGAKSRVVLDKPEYRASGPIDWSKDGKRVLVLLQKQDLSVEIAWVSVSDGAIKPIKSLGWRALGANVMPKLSRDEKFILYSALATDPGKYPPPPGYSQDTHVYLLSADGSNESEIVKGAGRNDGPVWAPDGAHVLFVSNRRGTTFDLWSIPVQAGKAAGELQLVSEEVGRMFTLAVSGSTYFFTNTRRGGSDVFVANIRQGKATNMHRLAEFVGSNTGPAWSADGKLIAFKRQRPNGNLWDVVIRSVATGEETRYDTASPKFGRGAWFHDNKSMLVMMPAPGSGYGRLDLASRKTSPVAPVAGGLNVLSPDDAFLYVAAAPGPGPGVTAGTLGVSTEITALNLATKESKVIFKPKPGEGEYGLTISPDGRRLAIVAGPMPYKPGQPNDVHLFTIGVDGSGQREVYNFQVAYAGWEHTLNWTRDGYIYFSVAGQPGAPDARIDHVARIPEAGGTPELLGIEIRSTPAPMTHDLDVSPDGSQVVFATDDANISQVWAIDNIQAALK